MRNENLQSDFSQADQYIFSQSGHVPFPENNEHFDQKESVKNGQSDIAARQRPMRRKFKIEKKFSCPSAQFLQALVKIENILIFMEQPDLDPSSDQSSTTQTSAAEFNRQLELEFDDINLKRNRHSDSAVLNQSEALPKINRENLKILTMVTNEITDALIQQDKRISITKLDTNDALRLARNIKKQLADRKIALATDKTDARTGMRLRYKLA